MCGPINFMTMFVCCRAWYSHFLTKVQCDEGRQFCLSIIIILWSKQKCRSGVKPLTSLSVHMQKNSWVVSDLIWRAKVHWKKKDSEVLIPSRRPENFRKKHIKKSFSVLHFLNKQKNDCLERKIKIRLKINTQNWDHTHVNVHRLLPLQNILYKSHSFSLFYSDNFLGKTNETVTEIFGGDSIRSRMFRVKIWFHLSKPMELEEGG